MGLRIYKALGWGMLCPQKDFLSIINEENVYIDKTAQEYSEFLDIKYPSNKDNDDLYDNLDVFMRPTPKSMRHLFVSAYEFDSESSLIVMIPPSCSEWYRFDDSIDYAEVEIAQKRGNIDALTNTADFHDWNPYPYGGFFMHAVTGEKIQPKETQQFRTLNRVISAIQERGEDVFEVMNKDLGMPGFEEAGFKDLEDYMNNCVPYVPQELRDVNDWLNIFQDPKTVLQLRPVLATWWE